MRKRLNQKRGNWPTKVATSCGNVGTSTSCTSEAPTKEAMFASEGGVEVSRVSRRLKLDK